MDMRTAPKGLLRKVTPVSKMHFRPTGFQLIIIIAWWSSLTGFAIQNQLVPSSSATQNQSQGSVLELPSPGIEPSGASVEPQLNQPSGNSSELLKNQNQLDLEPLVGCWSGIVRREDLTSLVQTGRYRYGYFINEHYKLCFQKDWSGIIKPTVHESWLTDTVIVGQVSKTSVIGTSGETVDLLEWLSYDDTDAHPAWQNDPRPHPLPQPHHVDAKSIIKVHLNGSALSLDGSTIQYIDAYRGPAGMTTQWNRFEAFRMTWKTQLHRDQ